MEKNKLLEELKQLVKEDDEYLEKQAIKRQINKYKQKKWEREHPRFVRFMNFFRFGNRL